MPPARDPVLALLGATGLVGGETLRQALAHPRIGGVVAIGRRPVESPDPRGLLRNAVVEFDRLALDASAFAADAVCCALGTTIKRAGSQARFRQVDHDYVVEAARLARAQGAAHFLLVSALGADAESRVFYNRVKGEVERAVLALGFPRTTIVRPSLLLGDRGEFRLGELVAKPLMRLVPLRWRAVHARDVARVLVEAAADAEGPRVRIVESGEIPRG